MLGRVVKGHALHPVHVRDLLKILFRQIEGAEDFRVAVICLLIKPVDIAAQGLRRKADAKKSRDRKAGDHDDRQPGHEHFSDIADIVFESDRLHISVMDQFFFAFSFRFYQVSSIADDSGLGRLINILLYRLPLLQAFSEIHIFLPEEARGGEIMGTPPWSHVRC